MKSMGNFKTEYLIQFCGNIFEHLHHMKWRFFWKNMLLTLIQAEVSSLNWKLRICTLQAKYSSSPCCIWLTHHFIKQIISYLKSSFLSPLKILENLSEPYLYSFIAIIWWSWVAILSRQGKCHSLHHYCLIATCSSLMDYLSPYGPWSLWPCLNGPVSDQCFFFCCGNLSSFPIVLIVGCFCNCSVFLFLLLFCLLLFLQL